MGIIDELREEILTGKPDSSQLNPSRDPIEEAEIEEAILLVRVRGRRETIHAHRYRSDRSHYTEMLDSVHGQGP